MVDRIDSVSRELPALVQDAVGRPERERSRELRHVLRTVHDAVMRAGVERDAAPVAELRRLAAAVRANVPEPVEDAMMPRLRVFVRLLRRDAVEPAWMLASDNASGVVSAASAVSTWAGPEHARRALPLPTCQDGAAVFAWLPGFRDPRWAVPDEVYDLGADVAVRCRLDRAVFRADRLELAGSAWLTSLPARADDAVTIVAVATDDRMRFAGRRTRSPIADNGPALTELAWCGWSADLDLGPLARCGSQLRIRIELARRGLRRSRPLGLERGPLAAQELIGVPYRSRTCVAWIGQGDRGGLVLDIRPEPTSRAGALVRKVRSLTGR